MPLSQDVSATPVQANTACVEDRDHMWHQSQDIENLKFLVPSVLGSIDLIFMMFRYFILSLVLAALQVSGIEADIFAYRFFFPGHQSAISLVNARTELNPAVETFSDFQLHFPPQPADC